MATKKESKQSLLLAFRERHKTEASLALTKCLEAKTDTEKKAAFDAAHELLDQQEHERDTVSFLSAAASGKKV